VLGSDFPQTSNVIRGTSVGWLWKLVFRSSALWRHVKGRGLITNVYTTGQNQLIELAINLGNGELTSGLD
jgi:hypothetical protein